MQKKLYQRALYHIPPKITQYGSHPQFFFSAVELRLWQRYIYIINSSYATEGCERNTRPPPHTSQQEACLLYVSRCKPLVTGKTLY